MPIDLTPKPPTPAGPPPKPTLTEVCVSIGRRLNGLVSQWDAVHREILKAIHENPHGYTKEQVLAELQKRQSKHVPSPAELVEFEVLSKTVLNRLVPGLVKGDTPEATIVMPKLG